MTTMMQRPAIAAAPVAGVELPPLTSWPRRILKHRRLSHHNRLAVAVLLANLVPLWLGAPTLAALSNLVLANFALAVLIRQQYAINLLFRLATMAPTSWPLKIRWTLAKVYHFGGLHVGGTVAGTLWFVVFVATLTYQAVRDAGSIPLHLLVVPYALVVLLLVIVAMARPTYRARRHDRFERMHRFGGWAALALFWVQTVQFVLFTAGVGGGGSVALALLAAPQIWTLAVLTFSVALPWLRLRKVDVDIVRPSTHVALAKFDHGVTPFAGSSTAISRRPLLEWHSFANVPAPGESGFRLTISRAGDWTGSFVDDAPQRVWVKGITTAGVANIETLFRRVVYLATGSGIGPVLPHLLAEQVPSHLVWATRSPRATYGDALIDEILAVQPNATIWDTAQRGKPDMVRMAYDGYREFGAEAVICISNKKLTWQVVEGLERRGIPAYGAIWDS